MGLKGNIPKVLLQVKNQPLLLRLLDQLLEAGIRDVTIHSSPKAMALFSDALRTRRGVADLHLSIVSTPSNCTLIGCLQKLFETVLAHYALIVLGDVVFTHNPFFAFVTRHESPKVPIGVTRRPLRHVISYGLVTMSNSQYVIVDRPSPPPSGGLQWSGLFAVRDKDIRTVQRRWPGLWPSNITLGDFVNSLADDDGIECVEVPPFVNINTPTDYIAAQRILNSDTSPD
jgi:dTDP-glucose pyrophosphorylase